MALNSNAHSILIVSTVLLSVLSMLAEPNVESGANIDACVSPALTRQEVAVKGRQSLTTDLPPDLLCRKCGEMTEKVTKK